MTKRCPSCGLVKDLELFAKHRNRYDGHQSACKACGVIYRRTTQRPSDLRRKYGITVVDFDQMLAAQAGRCGICGTLPTSGRHALTVDHDHQTGKVRGLLCGDCNLLLGHADDSPALLESASAYLRNDAVKVAHIIDGRTQ